MLNFSPNLEAAINRACQLHQGQWRKAGDKLPYVSHCFAVAWLVAAAGGDETAVIAALLHDALEDAPDYSEDLLKAEFGQEVATVVLAVSEDLRQNGDRAPWKERKLKYLRQLETTEDDRVAWVAAADKIHNLRSMMEAYRLYGEAMWQSFHAPQNEKLWFYRAVLDVLDKRWPTAVLTQELRSVVAQAAELFKITS